MAGRWRTLRGNRCIRFLVPSLQVFLFSFSPSGQDVGVEWDWVYSTVSIVFDRGQRPNGRGGISVSRFIRHTELVEVGTGWRV